MYPSSYFTISLCIVLNKVILLSLCTEVFISGGTFMIKYVKNNDKTKLLIYWSYKKAYYK